MRRPRPLSSRPSGRLLAAALGAAAVLAGCSSAGMTASTTTRATIANHTDEALSQIDRLQRRGDCLELQEAYLTVKSAPIALTTDPTKAKLDKFRSDVDALRPRLPELAREDYDIVAAAYERIINQLDGVDLSDPAKAKDNAPKARDALKALDEPTVREADDQLMNYFKTCLAQAQ